MRLTLSRKSQLPQISRSLPTALPDMDLCFGTMVVYAATAALAHYVNQPGMMHTSGDAGAITTSGPPCGH